MLATHAFARLGAMRLAALILLLGACSEPTAPAPAEEVIPPKGEPPPAIDTNPNRNAYFGDVHVHTRYSFDAYLFGTRATPDDAYRFAKGEPLAH